MVVQFLRFSFLFFPALWQEALTLFEAVPKAGSTEDTSQRWTCTACEGFGRSLGRCRGGWSFQLDPTPVPDLGVPCDCRHPSSRTSAFRGHGFRVHWLSLKFCHIRNQKTICITTGSLSRCNFNGGLEASVDFSLEEPEVEPKDIVACLGSNQRGKAKKGFTRKMQRKTTKIHCRMAASMVYVVLQVAHIRARWPTSAATRGGRIMIVVTNLSSPLPSPLRSASMPQRLALLQRRVGLFARINPFRSVVTLTPGGAGIYRHASKAGHWISILYLNPVYFRYVSTPGASVPPSWRC